MDQGGWERGRDGALVGWLDGWVGDGTGGGVLELFGAGYGRGRLLGLRLMDGIPRPAGHWSAGS